MQLVPCPSCARHVKSSESACPFCSATLSGKMMKRAPSAQRRLERLAAFTFAATIAVTGCAVAGDESDTDKSEQEIGGIHAMYGMPPPPPVDAGPPPATDAGPAPCTTDDNNDADEDHGGFAALYGMPSFPPLPPPCPAEDAGAPAFDAGGFHAMYGMPPAPRD